MQAQISRNINYKDFIGQNKKSFFIALLAHLILIASITIAAFTSDIILKNVSKQQYLPKSNNSISISVYQENSIQPIEQASSDKQALKQYQQHHSVDINFSSKNNPELTDNNRNNSNSVNHNKSIQKNSLNKNLYDDKLDDLLNYQKPNIHQNKSPQIHNQDHTPNAAHIQHQKKPNFQQQSKNLEDNLDIEDIDLLLSNDHANIDYTINKQQAHSSSILDTQQQGIRSTNTNQDQQNISNNALDSQEYADMVIKQIKPKVALDKEMKRLNLTTIIDITLSINMRPIKISMIKSSGNQEYDKIVINAVNSTSKFPPLPKEAKFRDFQHLILTFRSNL